MPRVTTYTVTYTCSQCGRRAKENSPSPDVQPKKCPGCGRVICKKCHEYHHCHNCANQLSESQKKRIKRASGNYTWGWIIVLNFWFPVLPTLIGYLLYQVVPDLMNTIPEEIQFAIMAVYAFAWLPSLCVGAFVTNKLKRKKVEVIKQVGSEINGYF